MAKNKNYTSSGIPEKHFEDIYANARIMEKLLFKSKKFKCYIEGINLIHNSLELYLRRKIINFIAIIDKIAPGNKLETEKYEILFGVKKSLVELTEICYLMSIIDKKTYLDLLEFNSNRNKAVHRLLKKSVKYEDLKKYAKFGEKIKLKLSPISHSDKDINKIIGFWDKDRDYLEQIEKMEEKGFVD
ncbi:hypothetical protein K8R47_04200 [archaeon]|nr:hypothetical protein [archaeon]